MSSSKERQQAEYDRLMKVKLKDWPQGLKDLWVAYMAKMDARDAVAYAVREWVEKEVK